MSKQKPDLSSKESVAKGQQVYERIKAGEVKDVPAALDATYGRTRKS